MRTLKCVLGVFVAVKCARLLQHQRQCSMFWGVVGLMDVCTATCAQQTRQLNSQWHVGMLAGHCLSL